MRIGTLSRTTGLPLGTVKFYLRTGLLHSGRNTSATQAVYDDTHVVRLRLVRSLLEVGRLSLSQIHDAINLTSRSARTPSEAFAIVGELDAPQAAEGSIASAIDLLTELGWAGPHDRSNLGRLARVISAYEAVGQPLTPSGVWDYASAAQTAAQRDVSAISEVSDAQRVHDALITTHLGDALLAALRRLAHHQSELGEPAASRPGPGQGWVPDSAGDSGIPGQSATQDDPEQHGDAPACGIVS